MLPKLTAPKVSVSKRPNHPESPSFLVLSEEVAFAIEKPSFFGARIIDGATIFTYREKETIFSQGDTSDAVSYIQKGKVKLTVVSMRGKEAILGFLGANEFLGEQCLAGGLFREMTATAAEDCSLLTVC